MGRRNVDEARQVLPSPTTRARALCADRLTLAADTLAFQKISRLVPILRLRDVLSISLLEP